MITEKAVRAAVPRVLKRVRRNPEKAIDTLLPLVGKLVRNDTNRSQLAMFEKSKAEKSAAYQLAVNMLTRLDEKCLEKMLVNLVINSGWVGNQRTRDNRNKYDLNIPWAILMDPTSSCNLHCKGCWAEGYEQTRSLETELLDRIIREGKELGIYAYLYSGGEPLMRKDDLIHLAEVHDDCYFLAFTNATLVDDRFAEELRRVGNFTLAISMEGTRAETDERRGQGSYDAMIAAMGRLKDCGVPFGFSTCYHDRNWQTAGSTAYIDQMIELGCLYGWYFTYIPLGVNAVPELIAKPHQREHMYYRVRELRNTKPIFLLDFWNDGEYVYGCIAGGRNYFHINANGDVEPCAFIHYSDTNIRDVSLLDALRSPLFQQYRAHQPFNKNYLRPCPLLDNPEFLRKMVHEAGAVSTESNAPEDVDTLTAKTDAAAAAWAETADRLWAENPRREEIEDREWPGKPDPSKARG